MKPQVPPISQPPVADDQNKFRLVVLAVKRARQLHAGARPRVEAGNHKILAVAVLEVGAGLVSWDMTPLPVPPTA